ncbi:hypothetical protein NDI47_26205 [Microcoleus vaginatus GB1-A2]|uniref:hypothetical protein n=1 Tax=Microcoleus vaginatus TaxID=119532 RepID=UPI0016888C37|nr:hypothetical protein [Microcoleus sp. FACHB-61]
MATSRRSIEPQGRVYATTQISARKYRYKTVSRHQLLAHKLRAFEKVRSTRTCNSTRPEFRLFSLGPAIVSSLGFICDQN